ncbi:hypothetical protein MEQ_04331 [Candida albicans P87]|nr:hypothetical protein MEQ_04331 [Candida albicans P87]KHC58772.1 hypothetical protein MGE_04339 [Candida albicans P75010]
MNSITQILLTCVIFTNAYMDFSLPIGSYSPLVL